MFFEQNLDFKSAHFYKERLRLVSVFFLQKTHYFRFFVTFLVPCRTRWRTCQRTRCGHVRENIWGHVRENIRDTFERISWTRTRTRLSRFLRYAKDKYSAFATGIRVWGTYNTDCSGHVHEHVHGPSTGHVHGRSWDTFD